MGRQKSTISNRLLICDAVVIGLLLKACECETHPTRAEHYTTPRDPADPLPEGVRNRILRSAPVWRHAVLTTPWEANAPRAGGYNLDVAPALLRRLRGSWFRSPCREYGIFPAALCVELRLDHPHGHGESNFVTSSTLQTGRRTAGLSLPLSLL